LFNSYYNAVGPRAARPERGLMTRPSLDDVFSYRAAVDESVARYLAMMDGGLAPEIASVLELGLNHEQQHQELIVTDIKFTLSRTRFRPAYREDVALPIRRDPLPMAWHEFCGGLDRIGHGQSGFCFDNEGPRHPVYLEPFEMASRAVTNGEYLAFMEDGG